MTTFGENFKQHRKKLGLSQEEISEKLGVTSQAVSKWECGRSYPTLDVIVAASELFDISLDMLLCGRERNSDRYEAHTRAQIIAGLPDDETLRVALCKGNRLLKYEEGCNGLKIPLKIEGRVSMLEVRGSAEIDGDVYGNVSAGTSVICDGVEGNVAAGTSVTCDNVDGNVAAGTSVTCDNVGGNVASGTSITCDGVRGDVKQCGGDVHCERILGRIIKCEGIVYTLRE